MVPEKDKFNIRKYGSMKDWGIFLKEHGVSFKAMESEDKIKELESLRESGLPYQHYRIFSDGISEKGVSDFIRKEGQIFWASLCPKDHRSGLRRHFKLNLTSYEELADFITGTRVSADDYHVILFQYPSEQHFSGNAIFDGSVGIIEFIVGKEQDFLARGAHTPDPAIVKNNCFEKYSSEVPISSQRAVLKMLLGKRGYFEFVKGVVNNKEGIFFFAMKKDESHLNYFKNLF